MMYQETADMITRMISVPRATASPWTQSASMPYGFSTTAEVAALFHDFLDDEKAKRCLREHRITVND